MTKISALSDIGTSVAPNDAFVLVDVSDPTTPNKKIQQQNLFLIPDGSAGTPAVRFLNDTDVGLFRPTTNTLALATGGSERLRITSAGLVGVGTSSPSFTAHVSGAKNTTQLFVAAPTISAVNDFTQIGFGLSTIEFGLIRLGFDNPSAITNSYFSFFNNNGSGLQESLRITSAGLVGIGTSSPSQNLDIVAGQANVGITSSTTSAGNEPTLVFTHAGNNSYVIKGGNNLQFASDAGTNVRMTLTTAGSLGIGTTSPQYPLDVTGTGNVGVLSDGSIRAYAANRTAYLSVAYNGFDVSTNSGGMLFAVNQSERARIDSSGRLLVGTSTNNTTFNSRLQVKSDNTTASAIVIDHYENDTSGGIVFLAKSRSATVGTMTVVQNGDTLGEVQFWGADGTQHRQGASIKAQVDGTPGANDMPGRLVFSVTADGASSPTERMRITNNGTMSAFASVGDAIIGATGSAAGSVATVFSLNHSATSTTTGTTCLYVFTNGDVRNTNNSYGAISDIKLKENIVDANSQWDDIKALQVRKYNFKQETGHQTHAQIGLVAQEAELVSPGLVTESPDRDADGNDLGTVTKSVNYSVLYMKAVKALQEAMERIETLEAKVAALESA